ncbi:MAG: hypothetical protein COZ85_01180 [Candidatus Moranbacteria bacterium CG_4_8_14_3_um_filter_34_16]|nr:MAG: hypothetical protein COZ85_01180 [Candidatus Moranbacteria bacterium CG_4_8_14_3_um_filter_34_16]PJA89516.1 MAG: hypothetical protein CO138_00010 [Candidatus Moranbacteria bacterium CG_4_9_14_3_um_filter_33_15]
MRIKKYNQIASIYSSDNCSNCAKIEKYFMENDIKNKIGYDEKNIDKNEADFEQMAEDVAYCDINIESFNVPFLWAQRKCYTNEKDIINFFNQKLN